MTKESYLSYSQEFERAYSAIRPEIEEYSKIVAAIFFGSLVNGYPKMNLDNPGVLQSDADLLAIVENDTRYHWLDTANRRGIYLGDRALFSSEGENRFFSDRIPNAEIFIRSKEAMIHTLEYVIDLSVSKESLRQGKITFVSGGNLIALVLVHALKEGVMIEGALPAYIREMADEAYLRVTRVPIRIFQAKSLEELI
ncbi:hypothetical protein HY408_02245 [Candidatus Gottesmanbacteria bacterium]|nr:hypothetical protein [Candidatus Gottesmanbacteria bacterium]